MKEQYENNWKDYYKILDVPLETHSDKIERVYKALASVYHPDANPVSSAAAKMKDLNEAYEVLKDPVKRKNYNIVWLQQQTQPNKPTELHSSSLPRPVLDPSYIKIKNSKPGQLERAYFTVINVGGPYSKINIDNPNSWLRVTNWHSLSTFDELPLKVTVECQGKDWSSLYSENIRVRLDTSEARIRVDLETMLLVRDHLWHDLDFEDLKGWVKAHRDKLDSGEVLYGKAFRYRRCNGTGRYQYRLRSSYHKAIYNSQDSPV